MGYAIVLGRLREVESYLMALNRFAKYAWGVLAYNLAVILWGAYVRASGSGAGCGSHWPLCNGMVIPRAPQVETLIEFAHRLTSGFSLVLVLGLTIWAFRAYPKGHSVRLGAGLSLFFILTEALVGAGLVLFEWVAQDASIGRAVSMAIHLVNTFILLATLTLTAWWGSGGKPVNIKGQGMALWVLLPGILAVLALGVTGAITALGDTLFPADSLVQGIQQDFSQTAHFLIRLRVWHPLIAITMGAYLLFIATLFGFVHPIRVVKRFAFAFAALFLIQLGVGVINFLLRAPIWLQIVHLLFADLVWVSLILFAATTLSSHWPGVQAVELSKALRFSESKSIH